MHKVTRISWTFQTMTKKHSGTDTRVSVDIYRDHTLIANPWVEPGNTERLDTGEVQTYRWRFENPTGVGVAVSGEAVPYTEDFPAGIRGHLRCVLKAHGKDLWRVGMITSRVTLGEMKHIPGTTDSWEWDEHDEQFIFPGTDVLSKDPKEGIVKLVLDY